MVLEPRSLDGPVEQAAVQGVDHLFAREAAAAGRTGRGPSPHPGKYRARPREGMALPGLSGCSQAVPFVPTGRRGAVPPPSPDRGRLAGTPAAGVEPLVRSPVPAGVGRG